MKRMVTIATSLVLATTLSSPLYAGEDGAGCGPGKIVMQGKSGKDANTTAALVNLVVSWVIPPVIPFAMTTGTLGCDVTQQVSNEHEKETFFAKNEDNLTIEMARGEGEHLQSFASVMGIENQDQEVFFSHLQDNYENIVTSDNMLASIDVSMTEHPALVKYVQ